MTTPGGRSLRVTWYPATPAPGAKPRHLPLVIISHGFGGWAGGITDLAENLASKNYIVVAK